MKKILSIFLVASFLLIACKKDHVDASNIKAFQSSINDMTSSLPTVKQIKFNEALYILKTFGVEGKSDIDKINALGKLLEGMKVPQVFALADEVAQKNGIEWTSTAPPSLGEMNIFGNDTAKEFDPNDIKANSLSIETKVASTNDNGDQSIQIIPRLVDRNDQPITFEGAGLETVLQVSSNGVGLLTAKNLMQNNDFKGFNLKYSSLPAEKVIDNAIDITVTVKTTNKTYKMSKLGMKVNPMALKQPAQVIIDDNTGEVLDPNAVQTESDPNNPTAQTTASPKDPKATVSKFLNNLGSQNLKAAFDESANPAWGSYDNFSNPTSGFGGVKGLNVKSVSTTNTSDNAATVSASYDVTDKDGKTIPLNVTFSLKNVNGNWKISNYKINN